MKIVAMSDTHSVHDAFEVPEADLLLHAGDFCGRSTLEDVRDFAKWLEEVPCTTQVIVAGNHDWPFEREEERETAEGLLFDAGAIYLNDSATEVGGVKIWGSPVQPRFGRWAFNRDRGADIRRHWDMIPDETDILVTHGPPHGILDVVQPKGEMVGCEELGIALKRVAPRLHVFGHIHEAAGKVTRAGTTYVNASSCDRFYRPVNPPVLLDWPLPE